MLQAASDKAQATKDTVVDTAAKGTQNVQDTVKPYADAAADKTKAGERSKSISKQFAYVHR